MINEIDKQFILKHKDQSVISKYVAKKLLQIKQKIQTGLNQTPDEDLCFCGGEFEQQRFIASFYQYIKTINLLDE